MRLDFSHARVLAVVAHPDDAELLCAGTLRRAARDGAAIGICVMCRGNRGMSKPGTKNLAAIRRREAAAAAKLLDAELFYFGAGDGELVDMPANRDRLVKTYRRFRPTLVLAHDAHDYHADHRAAGAVAEAATWFAASRGLKTSEKPLDQPPDLWWMDTIGMTGFEPGFYIDISDAVELKRAMLACHKSQIDRHRDEDFLPLEVLMLEQCRVRGRQSDVQAAEAFRSHPVSKRVSAW